METPVGREREEYTTLIMAAAAERRTEVELALIGRIGAKRCLEMRRAMFDNGGGEPTIRDFCAELSNMALRYVCNRLGLLRGKR